MKKILVLALAILMIASLFVSCKNTGNNPDTTTTNPIGTPDTPTFEGFVAVNDTVFVNSAAGLNVRSTPSAEENANNILGTLTHGKSVARIGINEASGWSKIIYNGEEAYVKTEFLSSTEPEEITTVAPGTDVPESEFVACDETVYVFPYDDNGNYVSTGDANYYSAPNRSKQAGQLKAGVQLTRVAKTTEDAEGNGWSKLSYKDADGKESFIYMRNSVITTTNPAAQGDTTTAAQ